MSLKEIIKTFFTYNQQEKRGLIVLIFVLLLTFFAPKFYRFFHKEQTIDITQYKEQLIAFESKLQKEKSQIKLFHFDPNTVDSSELLQLGFSPKLAKTYLNFRRKGKIFYSKKDVSKVYGVSEVFYKKIEPFITIKNKPRKYTKKKSNYTRKFQFDPNNVDSLSLRKLGFSAKQSHTFLNYCRKGGKFYRKEDVKKIYGVSHKMYKELESFIIINKTKPKKQKLKATTFTPKNDLNLVGAYQLINLGIEKKIAWRIINFRKALNGFYSFQQLTEVYDITKDDIDKITQNMSLSAEYVKKINLNKATLEELKKHPYLRKKAYQIINFRDKNKNILHSDLDKFFTNDELMKIENYLEK